jgi:hypothetical protein
MQAIGQANRDIREALDLAERQPRAVELPQDGATALGPYINGEIARLAHIYPHWQRCVRRKTESEKRKV